MDAPDRGRRWVEGVNRKFITGTRIPLSPENSYIGEMTERPKVYDWKSYVPGRVPWVQIPLSPLDWYLTSFCYMILFYNTPGWWNW